MVPLLIVYIAEYTINQVVAPTLLFPPDQTPFRKYRGFYPTYNAIYQSGVLVPRTSVAALLVCKPYTASLLQVPKLALLAAHAA